MTTPLKSVIVTPQIPIAFKNGGIATFVGHFTRLLKEAGHQFSIIYTEPSQVPENEWRPFYEQQAIQVNNLLDSPLRLTTGYFRFTRIAELVAKAIPTDTDIVYYADWRANGFHQVRARRYIANKLPVTVTVLHGNSEWHRQGMYHWPTDYDTVAQDFAERYVAQHSDFVAAPSRYMLQWAEQHHWKLPPTNRVVALGYPFFPKSSNLDQNVQHGAKFKRIVFFSRLETRKGFDIFVKSLLALQNNPCLKDIEEIVLLGNEGTHIFSDSATAGKILQEALSIPVMSLNNLDTHEAQQYLIEHVTDTLVTIPSRSETLGFAIIEASLIPSLNIICSNAGGIPEIFDSRGDHQLFEPHIRAMTKKLEECLLQGPRNNEQLGRYDWEAANQRWLNFHNQVSDYARTLKQKSVSVPKIRDIYTEKSVDVCIPYYNLGKYLPDLLASLNQQTINDFNVFVVNDGSTDIHSVEVFETMKQQYANKGWKFLTTENRGVCAARNYAASIGKAEYLCFVDSDNIARPNMIERFLYSIQQSQDDCLTSYMFVFDQDGPPPPMPEDNVKPVYEPPYVYIPLGNCPSIGILENPFGDINCIMRRAVFETVGGFTTDLPDYVNQEDRELLTIISLSGYKLDVIPEFLFYYRHREDSRLRNTDNYLNEARIARVYQNYLSRLGLPILPPLMLGMKYTSGKVWLNDIDYMIHAVRWPQLVKALRGKVNKNLKRIASYLNILT